MKFRTALPQPALRGLVRHYWHTSYDSAKDAQEFPSHLPAMTVQEIGFCLKKPFNTTWQDCSTFKMPMACLRSHLTKPAEVDGLDEGFAIHLHHWAAFKLWGIPVNELADVPVSLRSLLGKRIEPFCDQIFLAKDFQERIRISEDFLLGELREVSESRLKLETTVERLSQKSGFISIKELAEKNGVSERQFQRMFRGQIGLSPQLYSKILRVNHLISAIPNQSEVDWQDFIYQYNYFDQSHLIRDFKRFAGHSPSEFVKMNIHRFCKHYVAQDGEKSATSPQEPSGIIN